MTSSLNLAGSDHLRVHMKIEYIFLVLIGFFEILQAKATVTSPRKSVSVGVCMLVLG